MVDCCHRFVTFVVSFASPIVPTWSHNFPWATIGSAISTVSVEIAAFHSHARGPWFKSRCVHQKIQIYQRFSTFRPRTDAAGRPSLCQFCVSSRRRKENDGQQPICYACGIQGKEGKKKVSTRPASSAYLPLLRWSLKLRCARKQ